MDSVSSRTYISIAENPDLAGIVKNLNDNKNVKCQTKYQTTTLSTSGWVANLKFTNLTIGKKYKISTKIKYRATQAVDAGANIFIYNDNDATNNIVTNMSLPANDSAGATIDGTTSVSKMFNAVNTNLSYRYNDSASVNVLGDLDNFATLCELPDNYIETTEF